MKNPLLLKLAADTFDGIWHNSFDGTTDLRSLDQKAAVTDAYYFGRFIAAIQQPTVLNAILLEGKELMPKDEESQGLPNWLSKFIQTHNHKIKQINAVYRKDLIRLMANIDRLFRSIRQSADESALKEDLETFKQNWPFVASVVESYFNFDTKKLPLPVSIDVYKADYTVQLDEKLLSDKPLDQNETPELFNEGMLFREGYFDEKERLADDYETIRCSGSTDHHGYKADEWFFEWLIEFLNVEVGGDPDVLRQKFDWLFKEYKIKFEIS